MSCLHYQNGKLYIEDVDLEKIASKFGTPCYVYSAQTLSHNWKAFDAVFRTIPHRICYAVKANSNISILKKMAELGSGFDIVSLGELTRVLASGGDPRHIVFSGVGKTVDEIEAAIQKNIYCFNVESESELKRLKTIAKKMQVRINIALRINPNIDSLTHHYISTGLMENKFGIEINRIIPICQSLKNDESVKVIGIACHIGSQITQLNPFSLAIDRLIQLYEQLTAEKIELEHLNIGGGLGIQYHDETVISLEEYAACLINKIKNYPIFLILEPGRFITADAGALLTRVEYLKTSEHKNFAIVDAGMNDLLRPALYHAWQEILPITKREDAAKYYDVCGPVCESADFLGKNRLLALEEGDLLAIDKAGAYGFSMSSNYNSRPRAAEILVSGDTMHLIRRRETIEDEIALETHIKQARVLT